MSSNNSSDNSDIANMLHSATIHLLRRLRNTDADTGLSPARLSVLSVLVFGGDKTPGELAQIEQVKPPTITGLIQALEHDGLVVRRAHAQDKRALTIRVTAKGRRKLINAQELRLRQLSTLLKTLNREEVRTLAKASRLMEQLATIRSAD